MENENPRENEEENTIDSEPEIFSGSGNDSANKAPVLPGGKLPDKVILLPLSEQPFFPAQTQPLMMNELPWMESVKAIGDSPGNFVGLFFTKEHSREVAAQKDFLSIGTIARMHHPNLHDHKIQFIAEGIRRAKIVRWLSAKPPYRAKIEYVNESESGTPDTMKAHSMAIVNLIRELVPLNPLLGEELKHFLDRFRLDNPSLLADFGISLTQASVEDMQKALEETDVLSRMEFALGLLQKELKVHKLQSKIRKSVDEKMSEHQRKFFLREQLKVIKQELGISKDDNTAEIDKFTKRLKNLKIPHHAKQAINEEIDKMTVLETGSPEYTVSRNHLDWLTSMPWGRFSKDKLNLERARDALDQDHYGMKDVKERILEFLAVGKLKGDISGSIILLVGAPGVGKTSIGRSVSEAVGRKFYRFSVGGMSDEAEIKGHRRTYIGAMPGKFIQAVKECGTQNPVIMLDEVDKIGTSYRGNPASALLEALDPEQNSDFLDHYLDTRFDLSKVLFICTANDPSAIPGPLYDRMEAIDVPGYITGEKLEIAKRHLVPKLIARSGMSKSKFKITDAAIRRIIEGYAREAGVRTLEKRINRIIRKSAVKIVKYKRKSINVSIRDIEDMLGKPDFDAEDAIYGVGTVTGLAWTALGGATLTVESAIAHRKSRGFKLTGQLGDVMQESAEIAYSYISANLKKFGAAVDFFDDALTHLHVPAGAIPKDGPSAGITMALALLSLARGKKVAAKIAMSGELSLTGQVLPVGGMREKILAARREKIFELIFPGKNEKDYAELPAELKEGITVHFANKFSEVVKIAFAG